MPEIKFDKNAFKKIFSGLNTTITDASTFWPLLSARLSADTSLTFRTNGARAGHPRWPAAELYNYFRNGKWAIRYGTDGTPKKRYHKGDGKWRKWRGSSIRRWNGNPRLLQASGSFARSFKSGSMGNVNVVLRNKLLFGTNYKLAEKIIRDPSSPFHREVLFITDQDIAAYKRLYKAWVLENMGIK